MGTPAIYDVNTLIQAGINPKTGLPIKASSGSCDLKENIKKILRVKDGQTAVRRFEWKDLPKGIDAEILERIIYYKGQGAAFYNKLNDKWYFLPYALNGTIDVYGRYTGITPVQFAGGTTTTDSGKEKPFIVGMVKRPLYSIDDEYTSLDDVCVILQDRSPQYNTGSILSRQIINDPLLDAMAECIPYMRTALIAGTGIKGMRVDDADQGRNVVDASLGITHAALSGDLYVPLISNLEIQELTNGPIANAEEYMSALQSLENFRLATYGLENGGVFQKKAHMLQSEQNMNESTSNLILEDSLLKRKAFCEILNKLTGGNATVEVRETAMSESIMFEEDKTEEEGGTEYEDIEFGSNDT